MTTILKGISGGRLLAVPSLTAFSFDISSSVETLVTVPAFTGRRTVLDATSDDVVNQTTEPRYTLSLINTVGDVRALALVHYESLNASVVRNVVSRIADGTVSVLAKTAFLTKAVSLSMTRTVGSSVKTFVSYVAGSLGNNIRTAMLGYASGKNSTHLPIYSSANFGTATYVRNTNCWMYGVDISGASMANAAVGIGSLVSPRHVMLADHIGSGIGTVLHFITPTNTVYVRTITDSIYVNPPIGVSDIRVGVLDSALPSDIKPFKILPANFAGYLPTVADFHPPVFAIDGEKKLLSQEIQSIAVQDLLVNDSTDSNLSALTEAVVGGDSGNAVMVLINGEAVLLGNWFTSGASCPSYSASIASINAAMTALGGGFQLTIADLSGFNYYG